MTQAGKRCSLARRNLGRAPLSARSIASARMRRAFHLEDPMRARAARAPTCAYDIDITWGETPLLSGEHVSPAVPFVLSSAPEQAAIGARVFAVDEAWLDGTARELVTLEHGAAWVVRGGQRVQLEPGTEVETTVGPLAIRVRGCAPEAATALRTRPLDLASQRWTVASFALHLLALGCMAFMPPKASSLSLDLAANDVSRMRYLMAPLEPPPSELFRASDGGGSAGKPDELVTPEQDREPPRATPAAPALVRLVRGPVHRPDPTMPTIQTTGILGVLPVVAGMLEPGAFSDEGPDYDPTQRLRALFGGLGDEGLGGLQPTHAGRGGGGDPVGTIGAGPLDTRSGTGGAPGVTMAMRTRREPVPMARPAGEAAVKGSLAKEMIRRVIQRHLNEVRFCYEEGLRSAPELAGRVSVSFLIAPSGVVQASALEHSSLGASRVEQCIVQAVRRWSFPSPDGGGYVTVSYPFLLEQAGR
jgi:TonB family protein